MSSINPTPTYNSLPSTSTSPRATTPSNYPTRRPWQNFFSPQSFTLPHSLFETTLRIKRNLNHFRINYAIIILFILFLSLLYHPLSLIVFLVVFAVWFLLFFFRDRPVVLFRFTIDDRFLLVLLSTLTIVALVFTGVWLNVLVSVLVGSAVVVLHAAFRSIDDLYLDEEEIFDGDLLSVVGGSFNSKRTGYTRI
ncbi:putative prenylated rab acceptor PRA1 [Medicago truncatula]|uniref:PRA1 family protein n=1 Tax=Medicago truncatula TaxID=3880 RepID=A0A072VMF6_MEDTR|nr:PRA1 family protein F2 [Medicago truncatula]KEH42613.1 PRA1 family protein [Medicago truncatula]RHN80112.1 putative prenylated rab acceptor PRA1 [Medicago truncatula]